MKKLSIIFVTIIMLTIILMQIGLAAEIRLNEVPYDKLTEIQQELRPDKTDLCVALQIPDNWAPNGDVDNGNHYLAMNMICNIQNRPNVIYYITGMGMGEFQYYHDAFDFELNKITIRKNLKKYLGGKYKESTPNVKKYNGITVSIEDFSRYDSYNNLNISSRFVMVVFKHRTFSFLIDGAVPASSSLYSTVDNDINQIIKSIIVKKQSPIPISEYKF